MDPEPDTKSSIFQTLQELEPLFAGNQEADTRDNAAGAVGRIISALGASLPLGQVVPVLLGAHSEEDFLSSRDLTVMRSV